jgi:hypothetical protein
MAIGPLVVLFLRQARMNLETHPSHELTRSRQVGCGRVPRKLLKSRKATEGGVSVASSTKTNLWEAARASRANSIGVNCGG